MVCASGHERSGIACRICRELDFDILLTGHQHMSVPGQMLHGTFIVQPAENGEEPLVPSDPLSMASQGCKLADFFNGVQLWSSEAQLSATSLANEIAGLPRIVRRRDLLTAYPYTNTLAVLRITGAVLRQAMERSAAYFSYGEDGRLRVSDSFLYPKVEHYNYDYYAGVEYAFDISKPVGSRVTKLEYQGVPVRDEDNFSICLNSYRASGTGGYECYLNCPVEREINLEMSDLLLEFFQKNKDGFTAYSFPCAESIMSVGPAQMRKRKRLSRK